MAAHRYWRVRSPDTSSGSEIFACTELQLRTSTGGSNVATGGTAIANGFYTGYPPSAAFDGNSATFWTTFLVTYPFGGHWIGYDLGSGNDKDIIEIVFTSRSDGIREDPVRFYVDYSDDGVSWSVAWYQSGIAAWASNESRTYNISGASALDTRAWRVRANCGDNVGVSIAKLELRSSIGGSDLTSGKTPIASQQFTGGEAANAFDGNASTFWSSNFNGLGTGYQWVGVTSFATSVNIVEIVVTSRNDSVRTLDPYDLYVDYSDTDGVSWINSWGVGSTGSWTNGQVRTFDNTSTFGKGWRLRTDDTNDVSFDRIKIQEIQMRSSIGGSDLTLGKPCSGAIYDNVPRGAIDDNSGTYYGNDSTTPYVAADGMWFAAFDLTTGAAAIVEIVYASISGFQDRTPKSFYVESTPDGGLTWDSEWSVAGPLSWTSGETKTFTAASAAGRRRQMMVCN